MDDGIGSGKLLQISLHQTMHVCTVQVHSFIGSFPAQLLFTCRHISNANVDHFVLIRVVYVMVHMYLASGHIMSASTCQNVTGGRIA